MYEDKYKMYRKINSMTHIEYAFRPVHCLAQCFGLAPYTFMRNPVDDDENIDISWNSNRKHFIWSTILVLIQAVGLIYRSAVNFVKPPTSISKLLSNVIHLPLVQSTGPFSVLFVLTSNRRGMLKIVTKLSRVDKFLFQPEDNIYRKHYLFLVVVITATAMYVLPLYFMQHWVSDDKVTEPILVFSHLTSLINDVQYLNLVVILKHRLVAMNDKLRSLYITDYYRRGEVKFSTQPVSQCRRYISGITSFPEVGDHILFMRRSYGRPVLPDTSFSHSASRTASQMFTFRNIYKELYEICCLINSMYGCTVLLKWLVSAACSVVGMYRVIDFVMSVSTADEVLSCITLNVSFFLWNILTMTRIFVIAVLCQWTSGECRRCMSNIQELLLQYSMEDDVLTQLVSFSDQLVNNKIEFTACGIFPVNLSVLSTAAGLVLQYLIVLLQVRGFHKS